VRGSQMIFYSKKILCGIQNDKCLQNDDDAVQGLLNNRQVVCAGSNVRPRLRCPTGRCPWMSEIENRTCFRLSSRHRRYGPSAPRATRLISAPIAGDRLEHISLFALCPLAHFLLDLQLIQLWLSLFNAVYTGQQLCRISICIPEPVAILARLCSVYCSGLLLACSIQIRMWRFL
jgi:hypothetical protein